MPHTPQKPTPPATGPPPPPSSPTTILAPPTPPGQLSTPDVTVAQIGALVTFIVAQAVAWGWIHDASGQKLVALGGIIIPVAWKISDSIIRHGRSTGNASRTG